MELWQTITENIVEILTSISIIVTIVMRSAKQKSPEKQAEWEERTAERRIEQKRKRLYRLRNDDEEMTARMKSNLAEEIKLEKELGENA